MSCNSDSRRRGGVRGGGHKQVIPFTVKGAKPCYVKRYFNSIIIIQSVKASLRRDETPSIPNLGGLPLYDLSSSIRFTFTIPHATRSFQFPLLSSTPTFRNLDYRVQSLYCSQEGINWRGRSLVRLVRNPGLMWLSPALTSPFTEGLWRFSPNSPKLLDQGQ